MIENKELSQRIITGVILGTLLLVLILFAMTSTVGLQILLAVFVLCSLRIVWEVFQLRRSPELAMAVAFPTIGVLFEILRAGLFVPLHQLAGSAVALWFVTVSAILFIKYTSAKSNVGELSAELGPLLVILFSIALPLALMAALMGSLGGVSYLLWILVVVTATDVAAYFGGKTLGGPKLSPVVSPGKTWTGLLCGVLAAVLVGSIWGYFFLKPIGHTSFLLLALLMGFTAQACDLAKSHIKRIAGVKDAGQLLPGHGGLIDRIDGHLGATALVTFFLVAFSQ